MDQLRSTMHRSEAARLPHAEVVSRIGERRGTEWLLPEPYRPEKETRGRPSKAKGAEVCLGSGEPREWLVLGSGGVKLSTQKMRRKSGG